MKKLAIASGLVMAMGLATGVQAASGNAGYWDEAPNKTVWKTGTGGCWRHGFWQESDMTVDCGGKKEEVVPAPEPTPEPTPEPAMADVVQKFVVYFDFNSSNPGDVSDISSYINSLNTVDSVKLVGYADRIGADAYNDKLSQKRAEKVASSLVSQGVNSSVVSVGYMGEANPVKSCEGQHGANLIDCLRANRRVQVEITGQK